MFILKGHGVTFTGLALARKRRKTHKHVLSETDKQYMTIEISHKFPTRGAVFVGRRPCCHICTENTRQGLKIALGSTNRS